MTHFNHEWDTTKTPAVPISVGDRYYAQDLNDDFNYLKHLPYEVFLQGRSRGVMISPNDTWDNDTNTLTLSDGFGVVLQDCIELDPNEDFVIPPKTHSSPRYERIPFIDTTLVLPNDSAVHYIVATPTKRSLLQRIKSLFTEQYASRIRYDGIITIQDTAPTAGQILVGLCYDKEYCLLVDNNPDQCKENIILKKWFGQAEITQDFVSILQSYYDTTINSIETKISISTVSSNRNGIRSGTFSNCIINIDTVNSGSGIDDGTFNNCTISINTVSDRSGIFGGGIFNNCTISINAISGGGSGIFGDGIFSNCTISISTVSDDGSGIRSGTFNNCTISIGTVSGGGSGIFDDGTFNNCTISINAISGGSGISGGTFSNCTISINTVSGGSGIESGTFNNCTISINAVSGGGSGISNGTFVKLYLTRVLCSVITTLASTGGKLNVLNNTVLHAS
jgi:hypothetical protein